jgi:hypothetical protein
MKLVGHSIWSVVKGSSIGAARDKLDVMPDVKQLLRAIDKGDPQASEALLPLVYDELRGMAAAKMAREKPGADFAVDHIGSAWLKVSQGSGLSG